MQIEAFFHEPTNSVAYLLIDEATKKAALIDPVLDYDQAAAQGCRSFRRADNLVRHRRAGWTGLSVPRHAAPRLGRAGRCPANGCRGAPGNDGPSS